MPTAINLSKALPSTFSGVPVTCYCTNHSVKFASSYYSRLVTAVPPRISSNHHYGFPANEQKKRTLRGCCLFTNAWTFIPSEHLMHHSKSQSGSATADGGDIEAFVRRTLTNCHPSRPCWDTPASAVRVQRWREREKREMKGAPLYRRREGKMKHGPVRQRPALCPLIDQPVTQGRWKKKWACWGEGRREGWERGREGERGRSRNNPSIVRFHAAFNTSE